MRTLGKRFHRRWSSFSQGLWGLGARRCNCLQQPGFILGTVTMEKPIFWVSENGLTHFLQRGGSHGERPLVLLAPSASQERSEHGLSPGKAERSHWTLPSSTLWTGCRQWGPGSKTPWEWGLGAQGQAEGVLIVGSSL